MAVIKVPKTPKRAFNPKRRASSLLLNQIAHLEWAALPASQRNPGQLPKRQVTTEGQAAERIGQLTGMVLAAHGDRTAPREVAEPVVLTPLPPTSRQRPALRRPARRLRGRRLTRPPAAEHRTTAQGAARTAKRGQRRPGRPSGSGR